MPKELDKAYEPKKYEDGIYKRWEESGFFNPDVCVEKGVTAADADPFTIVLPPPNVTGTLHMGHAAMLAIEDCMVRYHRMKGDRTLWIPGTDHAAVATESKVEGILIKEEGMKKPKEELGREAFLERVKKFAQESHDTIVNQSKKMGSSLDWSREAYTLDDVRSKAVRTVFKKMYDDGLIYRGYRVINWSVKGQSTCSDDELVYVERPAKLYTFKYAKDFPISIATTRPETKLGDTAVAVNPEGRWKEFIGREFDVQDFGQTGHTLHIKVIGDEGVEDGFGTGALGVTTAHSPIDFEMYQKQKALGNDIGLIQVIGEDGRMTVNAGDEYAGLGIEEARAKVVAWLAASGLLETEEDTVQNAGTSDRFKDVVEPLPKTQWFIDVNKKIETSGAKISALNGNLSLKERMQIVVHEGNIEILPERFDKTYFHWIDNLRDWCISRQIWFGHQIPVWYKGEEMYVGVDAPEGEGWKQDPDTLDTWFSSGLWTFSTLGWPENTKDLQTFHPTSVLETGYDILFFWVARMILMTTYTLGDVPFKTVYLHGLVRDEQGRKMSKSLGNIIDPLDMIEKYGTDATRLSLLLGSTPGNDMKLSEEKIAGFRNFTNKLWNISRFIMNQIGDIDAIEVHITIPMQTLSDNWILDRLERVRRQVSENFEQYQLSAAGETLRDFTWNEFADWYLEIAKVEGDKKEILLCILQTILKMWHPFMPYVTEVIWTELMGGEKMLLIQKWPDKIPYTKDFYYHDNSILTDAEKDFATLQKIITRIRNLRSEYGIEPAKKVNIYIKSGEQKEILGGVLGTMYKGDQPQFFFENNKAVFLTLARLEKIYIDDDVPQTAVAFMEDGIDVWVDLVSAIDVHKETARLEKEIATVAPYVTSLEAKLAGDFAASAPAPIVEKERAKLAEAKEKLEKLQSQLLSLSK